MEIKMLLDNLFEAGILKEYTYQPVKELPLYQVLVRFGMDKVVDDIHL